MRGMSAETELALPAVDGEMPVAATPRRRWGGAFRLYLFEIVTLGSMAVSFAFLRACGLRMDWQTVRYIVMPAMKMLPQALLAGIVLQLLYRLATRRPLMAYLRGLARPGWWVLWLRLLLAAVLMTYGYFWLKVAVPLVNPRLWDDQLWRLDAWLHFGVSPSIFVPSLFAGTPLVALLDHWYAVWVGTVFYTIAFWSAGLDPRLRRRFLLSCVLMWTLGSWLYLAVPAVGPVYVAPRAFEAVAEQMPGARAGQEALWENYGRLLDGRRSGVLNRFNPTRGVAAMPSLHVGAHFLFFLWARRRARPLVVPFALATALTFAGSLLTGWHYAVDGYAGMLLAWLCYRAARWREGEDPVADPAFPRSSTRAVSPAPGS
jgi:PAP2 superfamily protein